MMARQDPGAAVKPSHQFIPKWDIRKGDSTLRRMVGRRLPKSLYSGTYSRFLTLLREARISSGMTQEQVARRLGRPQSFVSKCESGERRVDVAELIAFCRAIRVDPGNFVRQLERGE
jgi:ribosome-binding protein aMBF1 (putative translation factor)